MIYVKCNKSTLAPYVSSGFSAYFFYMMSQGRCEFTHTLESPFSVSRRGDRYVYSGFFFSPAKLAEALSSNKTNRVFRISHGAALTVLSAVPQV